MTKLDPEAKYWAIYTDRLSAAGVEGAGVIILSPEKDILKYEV